MVSIHLRVHCWGIFKIRMGWQVFLVRSRRDSACTTAPKRPAPGGVGLPTDCWCLEPWEKAQRGRQDVLGPKCRLKTWGLDDVGMILASFCRGNGVGVSFWNDAHVISDHSILCETPRSWDSRWVLWIRAGGAQQTAEAAEAAEAAEGQGDRKWMFLQSNTGFLYVSWVLKVKTMVVWCFL